MHTALSHVASVTEMACASHEYAGMGRQRILEDVEMVRIGGFAVAADHGRLLIPLCSRHMCPNPRMPSFDPPNGAKMTVVLVLVIFLLSETAHPSTPRLSHSAVLGSRDASTKL